MLPLRKNKLIVLGLASWRRPKQAPPACFKTHGLTSWIVFNLLSVEERFIVLPIQIGWVLHVHRIKAKVLHPKQTAIFFSG